MRDNFDLGHGASDDTDDDKKTHWLERLFKPRDVLIRSQGRVTFINFSTKLQIALCSAVLMAAFWALASTGMGVWQRVVIEDRNLAIIEAKLSQQRLRADFQVYKGELERITSLLETMGPTTTLDTKTDDAGHDNIEENALGEKHGAASAKLNLSEEIFTFRVLGEKVDKSLARADMDFDAKGVDTGRIVKSRIGYQDEIFDLQDKLNNQHTLNRELSNEVNLVSQTLQKSRQEYDILENKKNIMGHQIKNLTVALAEAREDLDEAGIRIETYETRIGVLENRKTRLLTEKEVLEEGLSHLRDQESRLLGLKNQAEERVALLNERFDDLMVESGLREAVDLDEGETPRTDLRNIPLPERLTVLEETSSDLMDGLVDFRDMSDKVEQTLDGVVAGLGRVTGYTRKTDAMRRNRPQQALTLLSELESIHDDQIAIVSGLLDRTEKSIAYKQEKLSGTGLDIERVLSLAGLHTGTGGPEIIQEFTGGSSSELNANIATLEQKVRKLKTLDKLITCVPLAPPVDYYHVTSGYGKRKDPFTGKPAMHKGLDMGGWPGTNIYATAGGKVVKAGYYGNYGKMVEIDHGCGIFTVYGHLRKILVNKGDQVSHRDPIGKLGNTGRSTGPHVHYEIRVDGEHLDPMKFIQAGRHIYKG